MYNPAEPSEAVHLRGLTAQFAGDPAVAAALFAEAAIGYRRRGQLRALAQTLTSQSVATVLAGQFRVAAGSADEALRLGRDVTSPRWQVAAELSAAAAAGLLSSGPHDEWPVRALDQLGNPAQWAQYAHVRGLLALSRGDYDVAFAVLRRMHQPGDRHFHPVYRTWVVADLADAGVRAGHEDEVRAVVDELKGTPQPSPALRAGLAYGQLLLTDTIGDPAGAAEVFRDFPFLRGRALLEQGSRLRRNQQRTKARDPLRAALDLFEDLGVGPWADRSRRELNACGESRPNFSPHALSELTPQELAIARLAAQGMSNRDIATQLFLSHRTVGSHLYRIFPKLGVTSRAQLAHFMQAHAGR